MNLGPFSFMLGVSLVLAACSEKSAVPPQINPEKKNDLTVTSASSPQRSSAPAVTLQTNPPPTEPTAELGQWTLRLTGKDMATGQLITDERGQPAGTIFPDGSKIVFQSGRPVAFISAQGEKTVYHYDNKGNLISASHPDGRRESP